MSHQEVSPCPESSSPSTSTTSTKSIAFYSTLFGTEPAKRRPGYANFAVAEPPLKLVLIENPGQGGSINHLGVEVADTDEVDAEHDPARRGRASPPRSSDDTTCCYAAAGQGLGRRPRAASRWEVYTVLADSPTFAADTGDGCCGTAAEEQQPAAACC